MNDNFSQQSYKNIEGAEYDENVLGELDYDEDTCNPWDLVKLFKHKYKIHDEPAVTNDNSYVLHLAKDDSFTHIAAGLSGGSVRLFDVRSEKGLYIQPPKIDNKKEIINIIGIRFVDETPNLLLVGTTNGLVRLLDLRTRIEVARFENLSDSENEPRQIESFDRNSNSRLICTGTVKRNDNVHLLFYDLRSFNQLYRYCESHQDEITSVRFHPENPDLLCSGSIDGLINIFDVKSIDEDDALLSTINTESTVRKVNWHKNSNGKDIVSCVTHTNCFKVYEFDGDIIADFDRLKITEGIKRKNEANCDVIDCHNTINNDMMLLAGCNSNNGETLRSCVVQNGQLQPYANFEGNTQIVRDSIFDNKTNILVTAGERGFVTLWTPLAWDKLTTNTNSSLKIKRKQSNKATPY